MATPRRRLATFVAGKKKKEIRGGWEFCCFMAAVPAAVNRSRWNAGKGGDGAESPQSKARASHNDGATLQLPHCVTAGISWRLNQLLTEFPLSCPPTSVLFCPRIPSQYPTVLVFGACSRNVQPTSRCTLRQTVMMERPGTPVVKL